MSDTQSVSVIVERQIAYPPEKIWRALTQPHLIAEWLMQNDFAPVADHRFSFRADWGSVVRLAVRKNCAGIECLAGIPGSVGGTPVQNVGAYGQEVAETIAKRLRPSSP